MTIKNKCMEHNDFIELKQKMEGAIDNSYYRGRFNSSDAAHACSKIAEGYINDLHSKLYQAMQSIGKLKEEIKDHEDNSG